MTDHLSGNSIIDYKEEDDVDEDIEEGDDRSDSDHHKRKSSPKYEPISCLTIAP